MFPIKTLGGVCFSPSPSCLKQHVEGTCSSLHDRPQQKLLNSVNGSCVGCSVPLGFFWECVFMSAWLSTEVYCPMSYHVLHTKNTPIVVAGPLKFLKIFIVICNQIISFDRGNRSTVMSSGQHLLLLALIVCEMTVIRFLIYWVAFVHYLL